MSHLNLVRDIITKFEKSLTDRKILPANDFIKYDIDRLKYPISELDNYFRDSSKSNLTLEGAYIFMYFVKKHIEELKDLAKEIDEDYSSL